MRKNLTIILAVYLLPLTLQAAEPMTVVNPTNESQKLTVAFEYCTSSIRNIYTNGVREEIGDLECATPQSELELSRMKETYSKFLAAIQDSQLLSFLVKNSGTSNIVIRYNDLMSGTGDKGIEDWQIAPGAFFDQQNRLVIQSVYTSGVGDEFVQTPTIQKLLKAQKKKYDESWDAFLETSHADLQQRLNEALGGATTPSCEE